MEKRWIFKRPGEPAVVRNLAESLQVSVPLAQLMAQRNLYSPEEAKAFFRPRLADLHDPFLLKDMNRAVDRILTAMDKNERIMIYGDYDVDGTTSVALVYSFLHKNYPNIDYYIPDRYQEGYGISYRGLDYAIEKGYQLMIALDCGIKAVDKTDYARSKGLDMIICDHHLPGDSLPEAVAVLDPKREDCQYPYAELSGCGVGFKLLQAFARVNGIPDEELYPYLDLVAVSIASDIVPITGENRIMAYYGLKQLSEAPRTGLKAIINLSGMDKRRSLEIEDVVFRIGPRINAAGRMESGRQAVNLLVTENPAEAFAIAADIDRCNNERRSLDRNITTEALKMISDDRHLDNARATVIFNPEWHKGVIGIVASRLTESYYRPTVVLTESNGLVTGSARSVMDFDLYQAIDSCSDLLENFGGHMYAAGLTLQKKNVRAFTERFEEFVNTHITDDQLIPKLTIDLELEPSEISDYFFKVLHQFRPFGPGNMAPLFVSRRFYDSGQSRLVGQAGEHLKMDLVHESSGMRSFTAIAFGQGNKMDLLKAGKAVDVCYNLEMNEFRGRSNLQLNVKDIKHSSETEEKL